MRIEYWVGDRLVVGGLEVAFCLLNDLKLKGENPKCFKYTFDANNRFLKKEEITLSIVESVAS